MEQTVQKLLLDVQTQLSELEKRKNEFEIEMRKQKEEFENYKQKEMEKIQTSAKEEFIKTESSLNEREKKIIDQENFIRDQQLKNSKIIKLNVGGKRFTTTLTTLTSDKDSMLAAMFSGRYSLEKDEDGFYFIDRNGKYFSYILDYLRTGQLSSELKDRDILEEVQREATYYQLFTLVEEASQVLSKTNDNCIAWSNEFYSNNYQRYEEKSFQKAFEEISTLVQKGYVPVEKIHYNPRNHIVIFCKK